MISSEQFERELRYGTAMSAARAMLRCGVLDDRDYRKIDTIMRRKYRPIIGGLLAANISKKLDC